jgi:hypothetical protein
LCVCWNHLFLVSVTLGRVLSVVCCVVCHYVIIILLCMYVTIYLYFYKTAATLKESSQSNENTRFMTIGVDFFPCKHTNLPN